ncbi:MAG: cell division protein ZapE [Lautropia sp.]
MTVTERYRAALVARGFRSDPAQEAAIARLQRLADDLERFRTIRANRLRRVIVRPDVPRGVWLYGGVGRGKSFLMDCFFEAVDIRRKGRLHFHEFMRGVHRELRDLRSVKDPLDEVARRVAARYRLICFDEFHLSDIADAMILERLLTGLFGNGMTFVMTSNYAPDGLYPDGLHRETVLPAIELLKAKLDVLSVDAGTDYRRLTMRGIATYLTPLGPAADRALEDAFERLATGAAEPPLLRIENREITALRRSGGVVWFDFKTLCGGPRSQNDYLEIASQFHTVILSDVPQMGAGMASEARRFTWLIDILYDQRVKLVISAAVEPTALYLAGAMANEFVRTASRLIEMQSADYLDAPRRQVADRLS